MSITIHTINEPLELFANKINLAFGETQLIQQDGSLSLFTGVKRDYITIEDIRFLGGTIRKKMVDISFQHAVLDFSVLASQCNGFSESEIVTAFMEGWYLAGYQFLTYKKEVAKAEPVLQLETDAHKQYAKIAQTRANAVNIARDLCNEPANKLTPAIYADKLKDIFLQTNVAVEIIETDELIEQGFEAVATVGKGSSNPPKLAVLTLKNSEAKHVALVGKGVTFDSGGTNIKTGRLLGEMKMDMGGSAAVVGAMKLLDEMEVPVHVTAILPLVENVGGEGAFLPSDVIRYRNGVTVEVGNTDAEGRLILADGILYAQELGAETVIDIATLTGAIGSALGLKVAGIFSNKEENLWAYKQLGEKSGDLVWPMPLIKEYQESLTSDCADFNNMSNNIYGGAITAAVFLSNFLEADCKWVHIDMANTSTPWKTEGYYVPGASGFGVRLLTELVKQEGE